MNVAVLAVGNPILNVYAAPADEEVTGLAPGEMVLVGWPEWESTRRRLSRAPVLIQPGGTSINSVTELARRDIPCAFVGTAGDDAPAAMFDAHLTSLRIDWAKPERPVDLPTGRCLVTIHSGGERSLVTYLGAAAMQHPETLDKYATASAPLLMTEVYQMDAPCSESLFHRFRTWPNAAGRVLTLSAASAVARHRRRVVDVMCSAPCVVIGSESEFAALAPPGPSTSGIAAARQLVSASRGLEAFVTRGRLGCTYVSASSQLDVPAEEVPTPIDLTGAGDAFVAGAVSARLRGEGPAEQCREGNASARRVIQQVGSLSVPAPSMARDVVSA